MSCKLAARLRRAYYVLINGGKNSRSLSRFHRFMINLTNSGRRVNNGLMEITSRVVRIDILRVNGASSTRRGMRSLKGHIISYAYESVMTRVVEYNPLESFAFLKLHKGFDDADRRMGVYKYTSQRLVISKFPRIGQLLYKHYALPIDL